MNIDDSKNQRLKAQALDIRNKLLSTYHLDSYRQSQPSAYRGLIRMDYEDGLAIAELLPDDMRSVLCDQLNAAFLRAQEYYEGAG